MAAPTTRPPHGQRCRLVCVGLLLSVPTGVVGFVRPLAVRGGLAGGGGSCPPFPLHSGDGTAGVATDCRRCTLYAARSAAGRKSAAKKAPKNGSSQRKAGGSRSERGGDRSAAAPSSVRAAATAPKRQARTPPWQVMSSGDAQRNVARELERRRLVQEGKVAPHEGDDSESARPATATAAASKLSTSFLKPTLRRFLNWKRISPYTNALQLSFSGSYLESRMLPDSTGVPEIAFLGRSNVGKSSLLNRLATMSAPATASASSSGSSGRRALARVGQTPGATASVNFYKLSQVTAGGKEKEWLQFVDLPGYGYARLGRDRQEAIQRVAESYLRDSRRTHALALCVLLLDIRRDPAPDDAAVLAALYDRGRPLLVVATKRDKLPDAAAQAERLARIRDALGLPEGQPLCVSSATGDGCRDLWQILLEACETSVESIRRKYDGVDDESAAEAAKDEWEEDDDTVYSQGFDWIHGTNGAVMYEGEPGEIVDFEDDGDDDYDENAVQGTERETLKSLRQKARRMRRLGEI